MFEFDKEKEKYYEDIETITKELSQYGINIILVGDPNVFTAIIPNNSKVKIKNRCVKGDYAAKLVSDTLAKTFGPQNKTYEVDFVYVDQPWSIDSKDLVKSYMNM